MNKVEKLKSKDIELYLDFINNIFDYQPQIQDIQKLIKKNIVLIIKEEDKIVASVMLEERFEYIKGKKYYSVNYLGVLKKYRRMGYASIIFDEVESLAVKNNINYLELTSGNQRIGAHYFYKSRNFKIKDTTVFIKMYQ